MLQQLAPILVLIAVVVAFAVVAIFLTSFTGPKKNPTLAKQMAYECGVPGTNVKTTKFPVKFYLTAILFILFDIEVIFLYPWALVFTDLLKKSPFIFIEMVIFMVTLTFGLFYVWKGQALDWD
jgi:NADH-quinone oxidoreductase subunit A